MSSTRSIGSTRSCPNSGSGCSRLDISVLTDRTQTIRASVHDISSRLPPRSGFDAGGVSFLRRLAPTAAAGVTVPLALSAPARLCGQPAFHRQPVAHGTGCERRVRRGRCIVMIENAFRYLERGASPLRATLKGARQSASPLCRFPCRSSPPLFPCCSWAGSSDGCSANFSDARLCDCHFYSGLVVRDANDMRLFRAPTAEP